MTKITIKNIEKLFLFGGSALLFDSIRAYRDDFEVIVVTSTRHAYEILNGESLVEVAEAANVACLINDDINADKALRDMIDDVSLGIAFGAAEVFSKELAQKFKPGHFVDLMVIDLPHYRGAAHNTWQILNQNFKGVINIQQILGGEEDFHKGPILDARHFDIGQDCTVPDNYLSLYAEQSAILLKDFFAKIKKGQSFILSPINEENASFFPALSTIHHGWVNWSWSANEIALFINAFGAPYAGASTYYDGQRVFLKQASVVVYDDYLHPFCAGLVLRKTDTMLFVGATGALIQVESILDEEGQSLFDSIAVGMRLYTPTKKLDEVLSLHVHYDTKGLSL